MYIELEMCKFSSLTVIEWFSIECLKTKTKVITLANHQGSKAIHCPIKTQSSYTKRGKTEASKPRLVLILAVLLIGFEIGTRVKNGKFSKFLISRRSDKTF